MGASNSSGKPSNQLGRFEEIINKVAAAISEDNEVRQLGSALNIKHSAILKAIGANWVYVGGSLTNGGTVMMLQKWARTVEPSQRTATLRAALRKSGLLAIEAKCFPVAGEDEVRPDDIQLLKEKLKTKYLKKYAAINTSPVDNNTRMSLQQIFVNLLLILKPSTSMDVRDDRTDIDKLYELITSKTTEGFRTRFAFVGDIGVGKSTLFAKIAYEWAKGACLQDINLLFLESFQDIEKNVSFGNIVMNNFPEIQHINGNQIDRYIQKNQRNVIIFIDDINEKKMDFTVPDSQNAFVSIVRGDTFEETPVLLSTIPYVFDILGCNEKIRILYTLVEVKGFTQEGSFNYIKQFFTNNSNYAESLINFLKSNHLVLTRLAPYPIFCSMLCNIWLKSSAQNAMELLETFSQVLSEIWFSLGEQHFSKYCKDNSQYTSHMTKVDETIRVIGKIALDGLLRNQHFLQEEEVKPFMNDSLIACELGLLIRDKKLASREIRRTQKRQFTEVFCFPHALIQEYASSTYLKSLFHNNREEFNKILTDKLLKDYTKYKNILFFTAANGNEVGQSLMEVLCRTIDDVGFIMEVAFECHHIEALHPAKELLKHRKVLLPDLSEEHTFSATVYALRTYGKDVIEEVKHTQCTLDDTQRYIDGPSRYAKALCHTPHLQLLELANEKVENELFWSTMTAEAQESQIMTLKHTDGSMGPSASSEYAKAVTAMPKLQTLELKDMKLDDKFYEEMARRSSKSRIKTLKHDGGNLSATASSNYAKCLFLMPHLHTLELSDVQLGDDFYQATVAIDPSKLKIVSLKHVGGSLSKGASFNYARSLFSMPNLQFLELENVKLVNELFYQAMATNAVKSKIQVMRQADWKLDSVESSNYARGLFSMPHLRSLELVRVTLCERFYSTMVSEVSKSKIDNLRHVEGELPPPSSHHYAEGIFAMPKLKSLELNRVALYVDFFKAMATEASKSKIEKLRHLKADLGRDASKYYATGLCSMPNLQSLELHEVNLSDEFYASMKERASHSKIQMLRMHGCDVNHRILDAMLSLPYLRSLRLGRIHLPLDVDDKKSQYLASIGLQTTSVNELTIDGSSIAGLWKLGLHTSSPQVTKLTLCFYNEEEDSPDTISVACSPFRHLSELHIEGLKTPNPEEFCKATHSSCPQLTKLFLTRLQLGNEKTTQIIQSMKTHPVLKTIQLDSCGTDKQLDDMIAQVNSEGRLIVKVIYMI